MNITTLKKLKLYDIERGPFALKELLKDSLFYPACDIDGELIRYCNMHFSHLGICSFVYVDYHTGEERLLENLNGFLGYHLFAHRVLHPADIGADKQMKMPDYINPEEYNRYQTDWKPFAHWAVLERDGEYGEEHGPKRFSLLFLGAEGVAAYAGLYLANKITPKGIAIIQPGHAFGFNWTNFFDWNAPLARTVRSGKSMPEYMFYGGYTYGYNHCPWQGYSQIDRVDHYYPTVFDSAMTVWKGNFVMLKVYDSGSTLQIMDNAKTLPHFCDQVFVEYHGHQYEAKIGTYHHGDTLRGDNTIKELILQNHWQPGQSFLCHFEAQGGIHVYRIVVVN